MKPIFKKSYQRELYACDNCGEKVPYDGGVKQYEGGWLCSVCGPEFAEARRNRNSGYAPVASFVPAPLPQRIILGLADFPPILDQMTMEDSGLSTASKKFRDAVESGEATFPKAFARSTRTVDTVEKLLKENKKLRAKLQAYDEFAKEIDYPAYWRRVTEIENG